ncbi:MAG: hypothetical protein ABEJ35_01200 [Halobacteriaceae archaeon]
MTDFGGRRPVYITDGLLEVLLERAADSEPGGVTVTLGATAAGDLDGDLEIAPETAVLTDLFLPDAGAAVSAVFGMDLGRPPKTAAARFVSHPQGGLAVTREDHLAARVLVAVPPWTPDDVKAFDRRGRSVELVRVNATPPERQLE